MDELKELGQKLLNRNPFGWTNSEIREMGPERFIIQCNIEIDNGNYPSLEEATIRWLQLRVEGKI